jgi:hypothetical protein
MFPRLQLVVDCSDADFIRSMIAQGHTTDDNTTTHRDALVWREGCAIRPDVTPTGKEGPRILFQLVPEAKSVKNRLHLDVRVGPDQDAAAEVARLVATGATELHQGRQGPHTWTTMADPEGNEFCVTA